MDDASALAPVRRNNERFTEAVTSQAFALTLSRAMIVALADAVAAADAGDILQGQDRGIHGLERRGLVAWSGLDAKENGRDRWGWLPTRAGRLVLELCKCAGLQDGDPGDDFLAAIRERVAAQADQERETAAEQERRHREWIDNLVKPKFRPRTEGSPASPAVSVEDATPHGGARGLQTPSADVEEG